MAILRVIDKSDVTDRVSTYPTLAEKTPKRSVKMSQVISLMRPIIDKGPLWQLTLLVPTDNDYHKRTTHASKRLQAPINNVGGIAMHRLPRLLSRVCKNHCTPV
ncbi:hypothetical protein M378DRAFT_182150 [Amanita muscaria Koide BX008]|uniref:Uncharacterized protein n=1 Tax=Amanita muscaria (strain Koide BX008) TaxID=946122 RepID=A0A0C2WHX7_AMAMK|nr:hypothetical protein M378DRAFT_182150 [Amanita muscaria Koide BX008]